jgi:cell division protein FtsX
MIGAVAEVRYDRRWLSRLNAAIKFVGGIGALIVAMLAIAAALTVANVVRLAAYARRDEIEIMQLVGARLAHIRGPFIAEGLLHGGAGALLAILTLGLVFGAAKARYGSLAAEALGLGSITFCRSSCASSWLWEACCSDVSADSWSRAASAEDRDHR